MAQTKILVIIGPTASGKSSLAVRLAKKFKGEIISADSRQVYKGLDIGTGKITPKEMAGIPHYLLDVADSKKQFSVSDFLILTNQAIAKIVKSDKLPIVVGGTGFYIDALAGQASWPEVPPNKALRKKLGKKSANALYKMLEKKDPRRASTIDPHNKVRIVRALEIIEKLGKVPTLKTGYADEFIFIGLLPNDLEGRIHKRLEKRFNGIIRETKGLYKKGLSYKRMHELGLEYRYAALHLQNKISRAEMLEKLHTAIRQYAKRQMTWFKRNKKIKWFKPDEYKAIERYVRIALKGD